jgi:hypothetical protein
MRSQYGIMGGEKYNFRRRGGDMFSELIYNPMIIGVALVFRKGLRTWSFYPKCG